jgi:hypothetical protein
MKKYTPASKAQELSAALFALSRPPSIRASDEVTQFLCPVKQDLLGDWWVVLDDQRTVVVHEKADLTEITPLVQPLIAAGALAPNTLEILQGRLDAGRGAFINVFDSLPDEIKLQSLTEGMMIAAGRLPTLL